MTPRRVLVTGIAGQLAGALAVALEQRQDVEELVGVDIREPTAPLGRTRFVRADIRNPLVARLLETEAIDTVVHASTTASPAASGGRARMKERNVIGTMQLLAACQRAPRVERFVLKSSTAVYGSDHADPGLFDEDDTARATARRGFGKDAAEVEGYVRAFGRRRADVDVTILRFANLLGAGGDGVFASLFTLPVVPTVVGFDPRLQFCHESDAVGVLSRATTSAHPGVFNVAGDGVLYLSQCIRLAGRVPAPVPLPLVTGVASMIRRTGRADFSPDQLRFLQFGRVVDTGRLRRELGFTPRWSTRAAFEDFVERRRIHGILSGDEVVRVEQQLRSLLERRGQERFLRARRHETGA